MLLRKQGTGIQFSIIRHFPVGRAVPAISSVFFIRHFPDGAMAALKWEAHSVWRSYSSLGFRHSFSVFNISSIRCSMLNVRCSFLLLFPLSHNSQLTTHNRAIGRFAEANSFVFLLSGLIFSDYLLHNIRRDRLIMAQLH